MSRAQNSPPSIVCVKILQTSDTFVICSRGYCCFGNLFSIYLTTRILKPRLHELLVIFESPGIDVLELLRKTTMVKRA